MEIPDLQHQMMGYDRSATMFSPEGLLLQVDYAEKAVRKGTASIGMNCSDGVLIVADKGEKDSLIVVKSADKIHEIDEHIMASVSGILSDARILINKIRIVAQQHRVTYDNPIDVESVIIELSDVQQQFTQYQGVRPFGVALIIAGVDNGESKLYTSDITGNYFGYNAVAVGQDDSKIKEMLRKEYKPEITTEEGVKLALKIFKKILGDKFDVARFNIGVIKTKEGKLKRLTQEEVEKLI